MKFLINLIVFIFIANKISAQNKSQVDNITNSYDKNVIDKTIAELQNFEDKRLKRIESFFENKKTLKKLIKKDNVILKVHDIEDGIPIYVATNNINASTATRTNYIQLNGELGLNLEGDGMTLALWEVGGKTLSTHVEFQNNGESRIIYSDTGTDISFHSTHVSGTLSANGIRPDARGMAPKSIQKNYEEENDQSEAAIEAGLNGLLISNHSYGVPIEGNNGQIPNWRMGAYNNDARNWDRIANNAPYYLSVFSAGNDGEKTYSGGLKNGFDKLTGEKNSKNNLVVANGSSVILNQEGEVLLGLINLNSSSSQGPSDDGRIKPDITGLGTDILSTSNSSDNSSYETATGTSMSAPNVSGSLILLQELYQKEQNQFLLASTLKALVLNTASDGGNEGPDARFGWGLLNVKKAANTILDKDVTSLISERELINNEKETIQVITSGEEDVKIMIVWNDPAGTAVNNILNSPNPALVNDLDLRVISNTETLYPWKLDLSDVGAPATTGDNIVDNVEQIIIKNPNPGENLTIEISHKSNLIDNSQDYSLIVTGITSTNLSSTDFNSQSISFWPNPVKNQLNVSHSENSFSNETEVSLYDMTGRQLINLNNFDSTSNLSIDVSTLSNGIYILNLKDGAQSIQKRIIKE